MTKISASIHNSSFDPIDDPIDPSELRATLFTIQGLTLFITL